ncbi:MAG: J domain-containing protein [Cypionkella sp.]|nr:J domain-containing protein [Cypionkella sp.]
MAPWDTLGIEPTNDIRAIKKAYSIKLKTTRPDDDAAAYQQLREAYEAAQQWVQYMDFEEAEEAPAPESEPVELPPPIEAPVAAEEAPPELVQGPTAERLLQTCAAILEQGGAQHLLRMWPGLQQQLEDLPIAAQFAASHGFAGFVLEHSDVPVPVLISLTKHFQWGLDYRASQQLGPGLAVPLQDKLHQAHVYAALRGHTEPADLWPMALARLWDGKRRLVARLLALLPDPMTRQEALQLPAARLEAFGLSTQSARAAMGLLSFGGKVQFGLLAALLLAAVFVVRGLSLFQRPGMEIAEPGLALLVFLGIYMYLYLVAGIFYPSSDSLPRWWAARAWRTDALAVIPLLVALAAYFDGHFHWLSGRMASENLSFWLLPLYALIWAVVRTEANPWRKQFLPVCCILAFGLDGLRPSLTEPMIISLAFGWTLVAHVVLSRFGPVFELVYEEGLKLRFLVRVPFLFLGIKLVLVVWAVLLLLCLPVLLFRMVAQRGALYVYLAMLAGLSLEAAMAVSEVPAHATVPVWVLAAVLVIQLFQAGCQALAYAGLRKAQKVSA